MINLSPFLLNEQFVKGRTCAFNDLNNLKSCSFFYSIFNINSIQLLIIYLYFVLMFLIALFFFMLLLATHELFHLLIHLHLFYIYYLSMYCDDKFNKSIDFVYI